MESQNRKAIKIALRAWQLFLQFVKNVRAGKLG